MDKLLETLISRPLVILCALVYFILSGALAYITIPKEQEPDIDMGMVMVNVTLEGVSPLDAERLLARPLEEHLSEIDGLDEMTSTSFQGGVRVMLQFDLGVDMDAALQDVRTKIDMARPEMPQDIKEPRAEESRVTFRPLMAIGLSGDMSQRILSRHARELRDAIMSDPDILSVDLSGLREESVEVIIDPAKVQSYRLSYSELANLFNRGNRLVAAGKLDTGQGSFSISVPGLFEGAADILNMPVKSNGNAIVRLGDIADVRRTFKDAESFVRVNGRPAISLELRKQAGANLIQTAERVYDTMDRLRANWPEKLRVDITMDGTRNMKGQFFTLQNSVILAIFLVMVVVVASLGVGSGLLVGVSIPGAFLTAVFIIQQWGYTLAVPVMFGLIIAVGLLVDGAIVVVEYADRKIAEGLDKREAYIKAAQRMAWPTISSTATTIAAFSPLLLWPGAQGEMISYIPFTLNIVLVASLFMALIFIPTLGSLVARPKKDSFDGYMSQPDTEPLDIEKLPLMTKLYARFLKGALKHPGKMVSGTVLLLMTTIYLYSIAGSGISFFPRSDPLRFYLLIHAPGNLSVEEKDSLLGEVESRVSHIVDFENIYSRTRTDVDQFADDVVGRLALNLRDWRQRRKTQVIYDEVVALTANVPGVRVELVEDGANPFANKPIDIQVSGLDLDLIDETLEHLKRGMAELGDFKNIEDTRALPGIEWRIEVDRAEAARFGTDLMTVGNTVRLVTNGLKLGTYRPDDSDDELDILVRYPEELRTLDQLSEIRIQTMRGLVPLSNFVDRIPVRPSSKITRVNRDRVMSVSSDVELGVLASNKVIELRAWLEENPANPEVRIAFRGEQETQQESSAFLGLAMGVALFLMAAILLVQFNSFYSVFLILSSVILSTTGVLLGYLITGQPFVILMSGLGIIALAGIVVNNNIVLIDTYMRLIKTAPNPYEAILQTGARRLRPVLLTTATTCLGLLPMAGTLTIDFFTREVALGAPATLWWQQLAVTIIFGLAFSTILTLVVTPCALYLKVKLAEHKRDSAWLYVGVIVNWAFTTAPKIKRRLGLST